MQTQHCTLNNAHSTLHTQQCIFNIAHSTMHTKHCTLNNTHSTLHIQQYTINIVRSTLFEKLNTFLILIAHCLQETWLNTQLYTFPIGHSPLCHKFTVPDLFPLSHNVSQHGPALNKTTLTELAWMRVLFLLQLRCHLNVPLSLASSQCCSIPGIVQNNTIT